MSEVRTGGTAPNTVTVIGIVDSSGVVRALGGTTGVSLLVESTSVSKGYQQLTSTAASATLASLCSGGVLPTGATRVLLTANATIRIRDDGNPTGTVGYPIYANTEWKYDGDTLATLKVYGAATIDCWFYA